MPDERDNATHRVEEAPCLTRPIASNCTNQPTPMDMYGATVQLIANVTPPSYRAFIQRLWHWQGPRPPATIDGMNTCLALLLSNRPINISTRQTWDHTKTARKLRPRFVLNRAYALAWEDRRRARLKP